MGKVARGLTGIVACLAWGCGDAAREAAFDSAGQGATESGPGQTASGPDSATGGSSSADSEVDEALFDVGDGSPGSGDPVGEGGCTKVDFLFVIDSSGSMRDEQENLVNSFPGFIGALRSTLKAHDYHVMVVDTDAASCCGGDPNGGCSGFNCGSLPPRPADACGDVLGAGVVHPWGNEASNAACSVAAGRRYMTEADQDLEEAFACVGKVGTTGWGGEQQAEAALEAVSDALGGPGACNEGFLRDDAILVLTIITDEEDALIAGGVVTGGSAGEPADWVSALVAAKDGRNDAIVVLGLVGDADLPNPICVGASDAGGADPAPRLRAFFDAFDYNVVGSVCAPDYTPFFQEAIGVIDTTCDNYVPEG